MPQSDKSPKRPATVTDELAEKVAKRVMELLRERARIDNERRGRTTRRQQ